ncbi:capsular exopolysaccharide family [Quadrisphaera granulorum]|uniref:non-specific protein-tyrosine kinase n=1 Tax=Quadrisphaera granulorum TaxID=317664 RepID=A0A316AE69_9ACTN|nr:polysaccharide biosynthesis tyrosine autokinase [Quadrisphaera granulorum]PWJ56043.1 capsular exopolysaccharide synthesis family protein [Quadrisphaera granulorum]SZE94677.1 capsular exopolysaccharide family [Quadrisphaera granulorum]
MELVDYVVLLRRRWLVLVLGGMLGGVLGVVSTVGQPDSFRAEATVFLSLDRGGSVSELAQGSSYTQGIIQSYVLLVTTPTVLQPVIDELGLDTTPQRLAKNITASSPVETVVIEIGATAGSARGAADVANAVASQLAVAVSDLEPSASSNSERIKVTTIAPASPPPFAFAPQRKLMAVLGLAAGLGLAVLFVVLRELLDTKVRTEEDVALVTEAPVLGAISERAGSEPELVPFSGDAGSPRGESYRRLRSNVQFMNLEGTSQVVVVTSSSAGEGKSTTAVNLAVTMAGAGARVLLIDADLRRPTVAKILGLVGEAGLATVLSGRAALADVLQPVGPQRMDVLTSGETPPNPNELLGSHQMGVLLQAAREQYDVVVLDAPPLLPVSDAAVLAAQADGALLVVNGSMTTRKHVETSIQSLLMARARLMGVVLNRVKGQVSSPYYYGPTVAQKPWGLRLRRSPA